MGGNEVQDLEDSSGMTYAVEMQCSHSFQAPDYRAVSRVRLAEQYKWMAQSKAGANWHIKLLSILYKSSQISLLQDQPAD